MMRSADAATYFVTDLEMDGLDPNRNSMISLASVAINVEKGVLDQFVANVRPRAGKQPDARTMAWWAGFPEAYAASTKDAADPRDVMNAFADWVETFPGPRAFAARPLLFDGLWMDMYLREFTETSILANPSLPRKIFDGAGLDIPSFLGGMFGWAYEDCAKVDFPDDWLGGVQHTHRAIDDAMGYAHLLLKALRLSVAQPRKNEDFRGTAA